jgi:hypothetical protein
MSDQPPEDLGTRAVLLALAFVLVVVATILTIAL